MAGLTGAKQLWVSLQEESQTIEIDCDTEVLGLHVGRGDTVARSQLTILHRKPGLRAYILLKAIMLDSSRIDLRGNLEIQRGAKHTDSYLKMDVLILSPEAGAIAIPALEITENDVKGGHGATVGKVSAEQLFYLRSKGLAEDEATKIIAYGFASELLERIQDPQLRQQAETELSKLVD